VAPNREEKHLKYAQNMPINASPRLGMHSILLGPQNNLEKTPNLSLLSFA